MMWRFFLLILAILIILSMAGYAFYLWRQVQKQNALIKKKQSERLLRLIESVELIARAMKQEQCDLSEGVIRLHYLLGVLGQPKLADFPSMQALFAVVQDMPILDERKNLAKNERMKQDFARLRAEADFREKIHQEIDQLLEQLAQVKKDI